MRDNVAAWRHHERGYCLHLSHRLHLRCWREWVYQSFCSKHNRTCFHGCPIEGDK